MFRVLIYDRSDDSVRTVVAYELGYSDDLENLESGEVDNLFGAQKQEGLWLCTYDNAIINFYGIEKEECNRIVREAFEKQAIDLTAYDRFEWIYQEEE